MSDGSLRPAMSEEVAQSLAYALRFDDRGKPMRRADDIMAVITANWLVRHLERSGFVIMKKPPAPPHSV